MLPGTIIAGKFRVERVIGKGGMGTVVVATHLQLEQRVAIKFLNPELANQPAIAERFLREARSSAKLRSDYVCRVIDVAQQDDGSPYIVMECLEGEDLGRLVARSPIPIATAADFVAQACVAIAEAHAAGIVHRDLKPSNLFLTQRLDGTALVKVLDFGIATAPTGGEARLTQTTSLMGSPGYMSPEQLRSAKEADARSDVWSLGVILYELVSGRLPFPGTSITEVAVKIAVDEAIPLASGNPAFDAMVLGAIEKDIARRYQSVAELATALAPFGGGQAAALAPMIGKLLGGRASAVGAVSSPRGEGPRAAAPATDPIVDPRAFGATVASDAGPAAPRPAMLPTQATASGAPTPAMSRQAPQALTAAAGGVVGPAEPGTSTPPAAATPHQAPPALTAAVAISRQAPTSTTLGAAASAAIPREAPRSRTGLVLGLVGLVAVAGGGSVYLATRGDHAASAPRDASPALADTAAAPVAAAAPPTTTASPPASPTSPSTTPPSTTPPPTTLAEASHELLDLDKATKIALISAIGAHDCARAHDIAAATHDPTLVADAAQCTAAKTATDPNPTTTDPTSATNPTRSKDPTSSTTPKTPANPKDEKNAKDAKDTVVTGKNVQAVNTQARALLAGDPAAAIVQARRVLATHPANGLAWAIVTVGYCKLGQAGNARTAYTSFARTQQREVRIDVAAECTAAGVSVAAAKNR